jgi:hypothetical protein
MLLGNTKSERLSLDFKDVFHFLCHTSGQFSPQKRKISVFVPLKLQYCALSRLAPQGMRLKKFVD